MNTTAATHTADDLPAKLSQPARRALGAAGVHSLAQLSKHTERDIAALHGMGPSGIKTLRAALAEKGLSFAPTKDK